MSNLNKALLSLLAFVIIVTTVILVYKWGFWKDNKLDYGVYIGADAEEIFHKNLADTIVIVAQYFSSDEIAKLKADGHTVYTYFNIGSIEDYRDYYKDFEAITLDVYENWEDERWVDVTVKEWQDFLSAKADELIDKGVDGFFIDNCDVYYHYPKQSFFEGLSTILEDLNNKDTYVLINGGDEYVRAYFDKYGSLDLILDGVNQESVYTAIDWDNDTFTVNSTSDRKYFLAYLDLVMADGKDAYALEYATDEKIKRQAEHLAKSYGYNIYVSDSLELN